VAVSTGMKWGIAATVVNNVKACGAGEAESCSNFHVQLNWERGGEGGGGREGGREEAARVRWRHHKRARRARGGSSRFEAH
jgi:hypothetical protein